MIYAIPKGERARYKRQGQDLSFWGYHVEVLVDNKLSDRVAWPASLLENADSLKTLRASGKSGDEVCSPIVGSDACRLLALRGADAIPTT